MSTLREDPAPYVALTLFIVSVLLIMVTAACAGVRADACTGACHPYASKRIDGDCYCAGADGAWRVQP